MKIGYLFSDWNIDQQQLLRLKYVELLNNKKTFTVLEIFTTYTSDKRYSSYNFVKMKIILILKLLLCD